MNAIILSIGDELVLGQTIDTNSAWLSRQLASIGCAVLAHITVPDDQPAIAEAITTSAPKCDTLIITGGLGPTADDLTRQALAQVMNAPLELNESWLAQMQEFFRQRGRPMPETNKIQAMIPRGARMLWNHNGTAAGIHATIDLSNSQFEIRNSQSQTNPQSEIRNPQFPPSNPKSKIENRKCDVYVTPGVPKEMFLMFEKDILPHLKQHSGGAVILSRTLHTFGLGESSIAEKLGDLMRRDRNPSVGTTVSGGIVSLRINARANSQQEAQSSLNATEHLCHQALGDLIFGQDDQTLAQAVAHLLRNPKSKIQNPKSPAPNPQSEIRNPQSPPPETRTIATAESCTGGLLAKMLTDLPGASDYFRYGWVTYANEAKKDLLFVPESLLREHGAVSEPVVAIMAASALEHAQADYALAISGIAGPTGGTPAKPIGTVCIALASSLPTAYGSTELAEVGSTELAEVCLLPTPTRTFNFPGDREMIRDRAAKMALTMLRYALMEKPMPF